MAGKLDVFISYAAEDRDFAYSLAEALQQHGLTVWLGDEQIRPGDNWADRLQDALDESRSVVFVIGAGASKSNWLAVELGAALALRKRVIPVIQEGVSPQDIPGPLKLRKSLPGQNPTVAAEAIARAIVGDTDGTEASAEP